MSTLRRVVKLTLKEGNFDAFADIFAFGKNIVASSPGCYSVELLRDAYNPNLVFTISEWIDEDALNAYRDSDAFKNYWPKIKTLLEEKTEVWSLDSVEYKMGKSL